MNSLAYLAGWTFIHFLWEAALLALAYVLARSALRSDNPRVRYGLACVLLFLMAAGAAATACYEASSSVAFITAPAAALVLVKVEASTERWLPYLAWFWFAGAALFSLRLMGSALSLSKLRRQATSASDDWKRTLQRLLRRVTVRVPVRILSHPNLEVPMVVGWLKPLIIVPAGALCGLTPQEYEAILAHELAHIVRYDYIVNLLQTGIETLFFFHPAVWWLSGEIRKEREYCCDDAAASLSTDAVVYARALWRVEASRGNRWRTAVAANGGDLKCRIERLVSPIGRRKRSPAGLAMVALLAICALLVTALPAFQSPAKLHDGEWLVAARAVESLNDIRDPRDSKELLSELNGDLPVREQAALALGVLGAREAVGPLTEALKDPSSRVRDAAGQALAAIQRPGGQERLKITLRNTIIRGMTKALHDPNPEVRGQALEILSKLDR